MLEVLTAFTTEFKVDLALTLILIEKMPVGESGLNSISAKDSDAT